MPIFHDPVADAAEAREVLRALTPFGDGDRFAHRALSARRGLSL